MRGKFVIPGVDPGDTQDTTVSQYTCIAYYKSVVHHAHHLASEAFLMVITIMVVQEPLCCRLLHVHAYIFQINVSGLLTYMTTIIVIALRACARIK